MKVILKDPKGREKIIENVIEINSREPGDIQLVYNEKSDDTTVQKRFWFTKGTEFVTFRVVEEGVPT